MRAAPAKATSSSSAGWTLTPATYRGALGGIFGTGPAELMPMRTVFAAADCDRHFAAGGVGQVDVPVGVGLRVVRAVLEGDEQLRGFRRREVDPHLLQLGAWLALDSRAHG